MYSVLATYNCSHSSSWVVVVFYISIMYRSRRTPISHSETRETYKIGLLPMRLLHRLYSILLICQHDPQPNAMYCTSHSQSRYAFISVRYPNSHLKVCCKPRASRWGFAPHISIHLNNSRQFISEFSSP